ncbi:hypothetical protein NSQ62_11720 [Solibacillus sp. FSL H8-0523]|uniref:hypothetical protein n=1 Tax=Solibacillus sp. FSL H8-0523 TaxID=2954511 RepID=UPI003101314B
MEYLVKLEGIKEFVISDVSLIVVKDESYFVYDSENNILLVSPLEKTIYICKK